MSQSVIDPAESKATPNFSGLGTLFWVTLRQHCRARRLLVLVILFCLPGFFAVLIRTLAPHPVTIENGAIGNLELLLIFYFIPHVLAPLAALLYASGMIQDEVEEQTLTYLLIRPLPRWGIYLAKLLATLAVTIPLITVFTTLTYLTIYWGWPPLWGEIVPQRALQTSALLALSQVAYCSLFGLVSVAVRQSLIAGVLYIILFEGVFANVRLEAIRMVTVMYYFRILALRWLDFLSIPPVRADVSWSIDLTKPSIPGAGYCLLILLLTGIVGTLLAILAFNSREFRVKTPEGS